MSEVKSLYYLDVVRCKSKHLRTVKENKIKIQWKGKLIQKLITTISGSCAHNLNKSILRNMSIVRNKSIVRK